MMKIQEAILTGQYVTRKIWDRDSAFCHHKPKTGPFKDLVDCDYFTIAEGGLIAFSTSGPDLYAEDLLADDYILSPLTADEIQASLDKSALKEKEE